MQILSPNPSLTLTSAIFAVGHPSSPEPADPAEFRNHHVPGQALQQLLRLLHGRRIQGEMRSEIFPENTHTCSGPLWRARRQRVGRDGQHAAQWKRVQHRGDGCDADLRLRPHHVQPGQVGLRLLTRWVEKIHLYNLAK